MNDVIVSPWQTGSNQHFCYGCGRSIHVSAAACPHCGAQQRSANGLVVGSGGLPAPQGRDVFCRACGSGLNVSAPLCPTCGAPQKSAAIAETDKSRIAAAVLALFLGGFGIHKFYLGQVGLGVLYLLFCWTFIPAFVAFIEAIVLLSMSDASFARRYPR